MDDINSHKNDVKLGKKTQVELDAYNASIMYRLTQPQYQNPDYTQDYYMFYYNMMLNHMLVGTQSLTTILSLFPGGEIFDVAMFLNHVANYKEGDQALIIADLAALGIDVAAEFADEIIDAVKRAKRAAVKIITGAIEKDIAIAVKLTKIGDALDNIIWRGTKVANGVTIVDDIGAFGEHIAEAMLDQNGWNNFKYIKNGSDNGIDIIAQASDGHWGFFEVKTSSIGNIPDLSPRQANMDDFVNDILYNAKEGLGRYQNIDSATKEAAAFVYNQYKNNPYNFSGNIIGIDLKSGIIRASSWER